MNEQDFATIRKKALAQAKKRDAEIKQAIINGANDYKYFDLGRVWNSKLLPIAQSEPAVSILDRDLGKFMRIKERDANEHFKRQGINTTVSFGYKENSLPYMLDSCDWRYSKVGRRKSWDDYICHSACHWLANFALYLAKTHQPKRAWQIITSNKHSSVVDLESKTFFDLNWHGMNISIPEIYAATVGTRHKLLPVGQELFLHN